MGKFIGNLILAVLLLIFAIVLVLRFTEGSFEQVGARIDEFLPIAYEKSVETARDLGQRAGETVEDIADGPDNRE